MISFIVPAYNEEELIGRTLEAIGVSARSLGEPYEVVVVDDASTDRTAEIAAGFGARVVGVNHRQIAATRNSGARASSGETLVFVDADTVITERALSRACRALGRGAVGGGSTVRFDGRVPAYALVLERLVVPALLPLLGLAPGCFLFCTREAYLAAGGFDETLYCAEEVAFVRRLKRQGRFVVVRGPVLTSGRKLRTHSAMRLLGVGLRLARGGRQSLRRREGLEFWYGPRERPG